MKITVVIPVMNQEEVTQKCLDTLRANEGTTKFPVLIVDNGSKRPVREWLQGLRDGDLVIRNNENVGVLPSLNQAWQLLKGVTDYIFFTHNDVLIHEPGWGDKIVRILTQQNENRVHGDDMGIGVAGFYGAKGLGTEDIYMTHYYMHQLIRVGNVSGCHRMDPLVHGFRHPRAEIEDVAVMDGFSLIVSTQLLNTLGGFDRSYPVHHNYDNDICLESLDKGYRNIVIAMDAEHMGGRTDVGEDWATPFGKTKQQIHTEAHPVLYEKWRPEKMRDGTHKICLPVRVS